jgi:type I restriction enzyme R subunit
MCQALVNLNSDLVARHPDYVCRVTADEGAIGLSHLANFQDVDKPTPAILTTSQLLTTGVDAEVVKNVVLARVVGSRPEFKQIIGRGTRLKVDYGKEYFNILDFTGTATQHFADPDFDGEPVLIQETVINETGETVSSTETVPGTPPLEYEALDEQFGGGLRVEEPPAEPRKFYVDGGEVEVIGHLVCDLDADGKKLQVVKYTEYSGRLLRSLYPNRSDFQSAWANADTRGEVLRELTERGISFEELAAASGQPDADPFDLLCHLAWNAPLLSRRQRAEAARRATETLFSQYGETAREILSILLDKYVERGILQFGQISELLKVQPLDRYGTPPEIAERHFGGIGPMREAVARLQTAIYQ